MNDAIRKTLLAALSPYRGDDLERARAAFRRCTPEQMQEQYGQSGRTLAEILAEYEAHAAKVEAAREWVERSAPAGVTDALAPLTERDVTAALQAEHLRNTPESRKDMRRALEAVFSRGVLETHRGNCGIFAPSGGDCRCTCGVDSPDGSRQG